jgi:endoglucanase
MNRRDFLTTSFAAGTALALPQGTTAAPNPAKLPRWRGFNLLAKFNANRPEPFREQDFALMQEWGFDFARLPMSYHCWAKPDPAVWTQMDERVLKEIDQAVEWGRQYHVHVNLNFHRLPGYCVNPPAEPLSLWTDERALDAARFHWRTFTERYRGIPSKRLSFDLLNEPPDIPEKTYARVARRLIEEIRSVDRKRLIVADGLRWGTTPVPSLADLGIAQSTRGYNPMQVSHYRASWVKGSDTWAEPTWPLTLGPTVWTRDLLRERYIRPWQELEKRGVGVHVGEWGAFQHTPHATALAWMEDNLALWQEAGWGWALWNLSGSFGILNSGRKDVAYEDFRGQKLDRAMLELLRRY